MPGLISPLFLVIEHPTKPLIPPDMLLRHRKAPTLKPHEDIECRDADKLGEL